MDDVAHATQRVRGVRWSGRAKVALFVGAFCALVLFSLCGFLWLQWPTAALIARVEAAKGSVVLESFLPWVEETSSSPTTWYQRFTGKMTTLIASPANKPFLLTREDLRVIARQRGMRVLLLGRCETIEERDLLVLDRLGKLERISLPSTVTVGDATLEWLARYGSVRDLRVLNASGVSPEGVERFLRERPIDKLFLARVDRRGAIGSTAVSTPEGCRALTLVSFIGLGFPYGERPREDRVTIWYRTAEGLPIPTSLATQVNRLDPNSDEIHRQYFEDSTGLEATQDGIIEMVFDTWFASMEEPGMSINW